MMFALCRCALPVLALTTALPAQDQRVGIGFEYGVHFDWPNDHRWSGFSHSFAIFFPIASRISGGYYQEHGVREAKSDGDELVVEHMLHELRLRYAVWRGSHQEVSLLAGFGGVFYREDLDERGLVGDIGGEMILYRGTGRVSGQIGVRAIYRVSPFDRQDIDTGPGEFLVEDFSGFQIGMAIGLYM